MKDWQYQKLFYTIYPNTDIIIEKYFSLDIILVLNKQYKIKYDYEIWHKPVDYNYTITEDGEIVNGLIYLTTVINNFKTNIEFREYNLKLKNYNL
jgi:hypothetical protein